ncbi:unnamed protein product, partial [Gulo gulo]
RSPSPRALSSHLGPRRRRSGPCPGCPAALASRRIAVTKRLCCETKADPLAPRQRPRARGHCRPRPHPGREGGDRCPGRGRGGADTKGPRSPGERARLPHPNPPTASKVRAPPPVTRGLLEGRGGARNNGDARRPFAWKP